MIVFTNAGSVSLSFPGSDRGSHSASGGASPLSSLLPSVVGCVFDALVINNPQV